jgi:hypothetical protein
MDQNQYETQMQRFMADTIANRPEFGNTFHRWPILNEDTSATAFDAHYIYHVAWAIRKVRSLAPEHHVDFSSSLHFCTTVSALFPTTFFDFRPADLALENLKSLACDLTDPQLDVGQHASVSCMHVVEHVGLGRYGDALDVNGDLKAIANLKKVVLPGGDLFFAVPAGKPSISFNAHRVYSINSILDYFSDSFSLTELYFIPGPAGMAPLLNPTFEQTLLFPYGCGCFHFKKHA